MSDIEQKLLTAKGDELSRLLGCVLQSEICRKCILCVDGQCDKRPGQVVYSCNDIPLNDWNEAMKHFKAVKPDRDSLIDLFMWHIENEHEDSEMELLAIEGVSKSKLADIAMYWLLFDGEEYHYLKYAALCKLKQKGK